MGFILLIMNWKTLLKYIRSFTLLEIRNNGKTENKNPDFSKKSGFDL